MEVVNKVKGEFFRIAGDLTPVLKESKFKETGVLTPDEFVAAGEHLIHHCPTWQWSAASHPSKSKNYLPTEQQFLVTKGVPCHRRCRQIDYAPEQELVLDSDGMEGWVDTHHYSGPLESQVAEMKLDDDSANKFPPPPPVTNDDDDDDDDDSPAVDMDQYIESGKLDQPTDPNELDIYGKDAIAVATQAVPDDSSNNIVRTRTYDLNITYDKYYQVPRMWLIGYDEKHELLTVDQMYEDFSADHAKKTITMEPHPHIQGPHMASIHPCRHAEVMKRLIEQLADNGKELGVHQYIMIFLKFVQAVIPTIEYDYTRSINL